MHNGMPVPGALHHRLEPVNNSIVFFRSDTFHEVHPVRCQTEDFADSRCAVTIWCHAGEHSPSFSRLDNLEVPPAL